jgi:hypothetical protein
MPRLTEPNPSKTKKRPGTKTRLKPIIEIGRHLSPRGWSYLIAHVTSLAPVFDWIYGGRPLPKTPSKLSARDEKALMEMIGVIGTAPKLIGSTTPEMVEALQSLKLPGMNIESLAPELLKSEERVLRAFGVHVGAIRRALTKTQPALVRAARSLTPGDLLAVAQVAQRANTAAKADAADMEDLGEAIRQVRAALASVADELGDGPPRGEYVPSFIGLTKIRPETREDMPQRCPGCGTDAHPLAFHHGFVAYNSPTGELYFLEGDGPEFIVTRSVLVQRTVSEDEMLRTGLQSIVPFQMNPGVPKPLDRMARAVLDAALRSIGYTLDVPL